MKRNITVMLLRAAVLFCAVMCVLVMCVFLPRTGEELAQRLPEHAGALPLRRLAGAAAAVLLLCACVPAWRVIGTLREKGQAFCRENARRLRNAAYLLWTAAALIAVSEAVCCLCFSAVPVFSALAVPCGVCLLLIAGLVCFVLGRLVNDSAEIKEENDLTV